MFRLIKLAIYVGIGYALYQLFTGLDLEPSQSQPQRARRQGGQSRRSNPSNMTGQGRGRRVHVEDQIEGSRGRTTTVGRGVVH